MLLTLLRSAATASLLAVAGFATSAALSATLRVPEDFPTIQAAVDAAATGDAVDVAPGTYTENVTVRTGIELRGREAARTLLAPDDRARAAVVVRALSGVRFRNFTLIEASTGISIAAGSDIDIANVVFERASDAALSVDGASSTEVINSVFLDNEVAIRRGSTGVLVESNIFSGNETTIVTQIAGGDPFANVRSNCFSGNADLRSGGVDTGVGTPSTVGDPLFVDLARRDFHLRVGSPCIDAGRGTDVIDNTIGDAGAYGGPFADARPFPVAAPTLADASSGNPLNHRIAATWPANLDYRVSTAAAPGSYRLHYKRGGAPEPPFDGTDAGNGTLSSPVEAGTLTAYTLEGLQPGAIETPIAPRLISASGRDRAAIVTWELVEQATGYRVRYGVNDVTEGSLEVGNVATATITGLVNGMTYRIAVTALNHPLYHVAVTALDNTQSRNESATSTPASIAIGAALESVLSAELTAVPGPIEPYPDLPDEGCFVATAAFGADWAAEVQVLRDFRDEHLLTHAFGRSLVRAYYVYGPRAAAFLSEHESLKPLARAALLPIVFAALLWLVNPLGGTATLLVGAFALIAIRWRRRARGAPLARPATEPHRLISSTLNVTLAALLLCSAVAFAQEPAAELAPRWTYEIRGGYHEPNLDDYGAYYGDDRGALFAVSGSYRLREWLEIGAEIGHMQDTGVGVLTGSGTIGGEVELDLLPVHVFVNFIYQPDGDGRFVPYAGIGVSATAYEQQIELQPRREGTSDAGASVRAGIRWLFASQGPRPPEHRRRDSIYSRSYMFLEAQRTETEIDNFDLGGTTYVIGYRAEFELGR